MNRPDPTEYMPYFGKYISLVEGDDVIAALSNQIDDTLALLHGLSESQGDIRYAPGKWSIKEVIGHLIDAERIFAYRALRFARNDESVLHGFDENSYVANSNYGARRLADLAEEFEFVRKANLYLFRPLGLEVWERRGKANDNEISVRAIAYVIAGHERHHLGIIRERYL
ncbi:MAG: DinB family protein [Acidobacteria bacterium]|nr:DinB family protein [Acidobacteriota bacterium]